MTENKKQLVATMLANGYQGPNKYLTRINEIHVTPFVYECGCPSKEFILDGEIPLRGIINVIADLEFGSEDFPAANFLYEYSGELAGLEVNAITGETPTTLPAPEELRPLAH